MDYSWFVDSTTHVFAQVLLVMAPVLFYQLTWASRTRYDTRSHPVMGWLLAVAVLPCAFSAVRTPYGHFDLQTIPLILAILYGGYAPGLAASAISVIFRAFDDPNWTVFVTSHVPVMALAFIIYGTATYHEYRRVGRICVTTGLVAIPIPILLALVYYTGFWGAMTPDFWMFFAAFNTIELGGAALAAYLTEHLLDLARLRSRLTDLQEEVAKGKNLLALEELAASLAHEVRNPLTTVSGFVQLLRDASAREDRQTYELILSELRRVNTILNDFISLVHSRTEPKMEPSDLNSVVEELLPLVDAQAKERAMVVHIELASRLPDVNLNRDHIKQLLLNLTQNAIDAMGPGGRLMVRTADLVNEVLLEVADTGKGIEKKDMDRLFDSFYTTKEQGAGLGLAICRRIAENHDAVMTVHSVIGKGSIFAVRFPVGGASSGSPQARKGATAHSRGLPHKATEV